MAGIRAVAYGGGVQSTALLVLAATARIDFPAFLFANVGDDSEEPASLTYVRDVAAPYAAAHGIALHQLDRVRRDGQVETLLGRLTRPGSRSLPIPVRMSNGSPGTRSCTADFKIKTIGRWLRANGASAENPATVAVGISLDEMHRAHNRRANPYERVAYPLLDLRLNRADCMNVIRSAGLPVPGKSSCWFCPLHTRAHWSTMRRDRPAQFAATCDLESLLNSRRAELGRDRVFFLRSARPLAEDIAPAQDEIPGLDPEDDAACDNGACWT
ncbi:hypothetical protein [Longispora albida]|uniref:hypothetical protein n=1 Tax=Longispora albida TaxID=203523 RepID=UPI00035D3922|nr:hypothetical protein [Longispora albida]